jgi:hypothetical protein
MLRKMGGEFDYEAFQDSLSDLKTEVTQIKKVYFAQTEGFYIEVPKLEISEKDLKDLNY